MPSSPSSPSSPLPTAYTQSYRAVCTVMTTVPVPARDERHGRNGNKELGRKNTTRNGRYVTVGSSPNKGLEVTPDSRNLKTQPMEMAVKSILSKGMETRVARGFAAENEKGCGKWNLESKTTRPANQAEDSRLNITLGI
ncbi:hypothetical protein KQX54_019811 [Cotesia glomerata]|uniref:Uncharacterized protein n=1 Tax=Cotesia glomerata TaxID=32391 RepID=A0AAV7IYB4_COTGL|nr:hypothetical protein KQX54_019811 [Cotesia glomerata]